MIAGKLQIGIVPADLARSLAFYRDVLQLPYVGPMPVGEERTLHNFTVGDAILKLWDGPRTPEPARLAERDEIAGLRWFTMNIDEIDAAVERCRVAGGPIPMPVQELRPGLRVAIVLDPDGNQVELVEQT